MPDRVLDSTLAVRAEKRIDPGAGEDEIGRTETSKLTHFGLGSGAFYVIVRVCLY
jgi:hypothetical protein